MSTALKHSLSSLDAVPQPAKVSAYDPQNLHPMDEQCRKYDPDDGIDYDEIIATTQDDWVNGNYKIFKSEDYPTQESFIAAMERCTREELGSDPF